MRRPAEVFKGRRKVVRELYGLTHILHNDLPELSVCQSMILLWKRYITGFIHLVTGRVNGMNFVSVE